MSKHSRQAICLNYNARTNDFVFSDSQKSLSKVEFRDVLADFFPLGFEPYGDSSKYGMFACQKRSLVRFVLAHHGLSDFNKLGKFFLYSNTDGEVVDLQWSFYYKIGTDYLLFQQNRTIQL